MAAMTFIPLNKRYRELIGNGVYYAVPTFQRSYSWGPAQWDDLWQDIDKVVNANGTSLHYMGYVVLKSSNAPISNMLHIIDGQQRLVTLSIIAQSVICRIDELANLSIDAQANRERVEYLRQAFIGNKIASTLQLRLKLTLNDHNHPIYEDYLTHLKVPAGWRKLSASNQLLIEALEWFHQRLQADTRYQTGETLAHYLEQLAYKLFFTTIEVFDEIDAYTVFETLNARGVQLSATDLLKNHFFSLVYADNQSPDYPQDAGELLLQKMNRIWNELERELVEDTFPDFLRVYWNSNIVPKQPNTRKTELYKHVKDAIQTADQAFELLQQLQTALPLYQALQDPQHDYWRLETENQAYIMTLDLLGAKQFLAVALAAERHFSAKDFSALLKAISIITFRYLTVCKHSPAEMESTYEALTQQINAKNVRSIYQAYDTLKPLYPDDTEFCLKFESLNLRKKLNQHILFRIENYLRPGKRPNEKKTTLEHIWPLKPEPLQWPAFAQQKEIPNANMLGNLCLLTDKENKAVGNQAYAAKRAIYEKSEFVLTRELANPAYAEWTPDAMMDRQQWLAKQAQTIWRLDYFHPKAEG